MARCGQLTADGSLCRRHGRPPHGRCSDHPLDPSKANVSGVTWRQSAGAVWRENPALGVEAPKEAEPLIRALRSYLARADLYDFGPTLALYDLQIDALLQRGLTDFDTPGWRADLVAKLEAVEYAIMREESVIKPIEELRFAIEEGVDHDRAMMEAIELADRRSVRAEQARIVEAKEAQTISFRQALQLACDSFSVIKAEIEDTALANRLIARIQQVYATRTGILAQQPEQRSIEDRVARIRENNNRNTIDQEAEDEDDALTRQLPPPPPALPNPGLTAHGPAHVRLGGPGDSAGTPAGRSGG